MIYTIIGVIILILALILLLILFTPFHISFYLEKRETDIRGYFQVRWLRIRLLKRTIPEEKKEEKKEEKEKKERKYSVDKFLNVIQRFLEAIEYLIPVLRAFLRSMELEKIFLNLNLGFTSPVITALISGYFWSISAILNVNPTVNLSMTPDFQKNRSDGSIEFQLKLTLYRIVAALLKAFTKKPVRELLWTIRRLNQ